ncbi:hypothetical protein BDV06DRAFT_73016 [Aspergillus oleicola]
MAKISASPSSVSSSEASNARKAKPVPSPSRSPPARSDAIHKADPSLACPGTVKTRPPVTVEMLPSDSEAFAAFAKLRADKSVSEEEAFFELLTCYGLPLATLSRISAQKLEVSFSNITYKQVAPYVWLDPNAAGVDVLGFEVFRSRIPQSFSRDIKRPKSS